MEKFWYQGNEVLDLLRWTPEELFYAWRYGLHAYENKVERIYPDRYIVFHRYKTSTELYYKFDIKKGYFINNVDIEFYINIDGEKKNFYKNIINELDEDRGSFFLNNEYFSICIEKSGVIRFYRNNNINMCDLNDFYRSCTKNAFDYNQLIVDPIDLSKKEELININQFFEYEIEKHFLFKERNKYVNDKVLPGQFRCLLASNEELCVIVKCYIHSSITNNLEERRVYLQIRPDKDAVEDYIRNPYKYFFDGFVIYVCVDGKTDWFIAPSTDSVNDIIALFNFNKLEKLEENDIIDVYHKAQNLEKNEYVHYKLKKEDNDIEMFYLDYVNSLYFKSDEIINYLNFSNINVCISPYTYGAKYRTKEYNIINNSLYIKSIKSKIEYSIEKNKKDDTTRDTNQDVECKMSILTHNDQYLIQELFKNIEIKDENKKILLNLYKFLENFKIIYKDNNRMLEYIDIVKYKTIGMSNDDIQNSNKILSIHNKKQSALRTYISRAKKAVLHEVVTRYGIDFPYIEYNQGIDKDETIEDRIYQIIIFLQEVEDNG